MSMKQQLREQQKKNHEKFRQQLVQDVAKQLQIWEKRTKSMFSKQARLLSISQDKIEDATQEVEQVTNQLQTIRRKTLREVESFKTGRSWKFFAACFGASLVGALVAVIICGLYWPTIRSILG